MDELIYLVTASRNGDAAAYRRLVRRFQDMAYGYACSILGDAHLAEDATQEAFIEAYERLPTLDHPQAFPAWLRRIVLKHCDRQTRRKRPKAVVYAHAEPTSLEWEPSRVAERRELASYVLRAIAKLPEHQREITTLFYLKGCSQQDIAAFLSVPVATIKSRLQQARRSLRDRMLAVAEEALRHNYLDDKFATHVVAGLLSRPRLVEIKGHPVQQVWREVQAALADYEVVEGDEIEEAEVAQSLDADSFSQAFHVDQQQVLRTHTIGSVWRQIPGRTPPIRILTTGRAFRDCAEGSRTMRVFHQIEGLCLDREAGEVRLKATVHKLLERILQAGEVRTQRVPSETLDHAFSIAVRNEHGLFPVGAAGLLKPHLLRDAGVGARNVTGFAFGFGMERLAMLKYGIRDIHDLWGPKYCPVIDNFDQFDLRSVLSGDEYTSGDAIVTPIAGTIPGAGQVTPGHVSFTRGGELQIRGETISANRIEGGWVGTERIELNMDLNRETGAGIVRNKTTLDVAWPERGLAGTLSGAFDGEMRDGGVSGKGVFHGSGGFLGMKVVVRATTPDLSEPFQYEGVVIEPPRK